jgi:hypothetical protein
VDAQVYAEDSKLGISDSTLNFKKFGLNGFTNVLYSIGNFNAGLRFESYLNPMIGFDPRYEGVGVPYWFASYKLGSLNMTAGHFYEQFGSGLILRSWEEWTLGYDNNIFGFNAKFEPVKGIMIKGLVGVQRYFWEPYSINDRGIIKGADGDFYLNDIFSDLADSKLKLTLGGSFVSRYENPAPKSFTREIIIDSVNEQGGITQWTKKVTYEYNLPRNVGSWAARLNLAYGGFNFYGEYAEKSYDPNATNNFIYKKGQALYATIAYSTKGFGLFMSTKWIDNMSFKSRMNESGNPPMLDINYLPSISKEHGYSLASMYPYATKPNGEAGFKGEAIYTIPKKTFFGGEYGTTISLNYSFANSVKKEQISAFIPEDSTGTNGYRTTFFSIGDLPYYRDLNLMIERKLTSKFKAKLGYYNQTYNLHVIEDDIFDDAEMVHANIVIADLTYKFSPKHSVRIEGQRLWTKEDEGDWATLTIEYNVSPAWFFSVMDEWNYGNPESDMKIHYYNISFGYTQKSNRISIRYGRQREGLLCVGGVCRYVPASTGLTITLSSSF